jgi:glycosyltransferase involved in cell wall biosynthesis
VCAARNVALAQAKGELIAYLDDDNIMHPAWLKSVAWGFEQRLEANVLYGAFVVDDTKRIDQKGRGDLPRLYFWPYDHHSVAQHNIADMGCIAHRAGIAEAHFDESLREMGDWDLLLRLTRCAVPLALPAIACFYTTDAPNRLCHGPTFEADLAAVRMKNRR